MGNKVTLNQSSWTVQVPGATFTVLAWHDHPTISRQTDVHQVVMVTLPSGRTVSDAAQVAVIEGWTPTTAEEAERTALAVAEASRDGRLASDFYVTAQSLGLVADEYREVSA